MSEEQVEQKQEVKVTKLEDNVEIGILQKLFQYLSEEIQVPGKQAKGFSEALDLLALVTNSRMLKCGIVDENGKSLAGENKEAKPE